MKKTILIAAVLFFALSVTASAQVAYTVASESLAKIACCGLAEPTGTIVFTTQFGTIDVTVSGTISATYNVPIANPTAVTVVAKDVLGAPIVAPGLTAAVTPGTNTVVISIPQGIPSPHSLELSGVRVNVAGSSFCNTNSTVVASLTSTGNRLTVGETQNITTVLGVASPLSTPTVTFSPTAGTEVAIDASNGTVTGTATITVTEAFPTAFGTGTETGRTQNALIRLTVTGLPTGVTLTFPGTVPGFSTANATGTPSGADVAVTKASPVVYYVQTGATNAAALESLTVTPTISVPAGTPFPLPPGAISVSAALGPITTATTATLFPQFTNNCETAAVEIARVSGVLTTTLLVPYAVDLGSDQGDYQTGIVVSNTTKDPGTVAMGQFPTAIPQTGKLVVYFFPADTTKTVAPWVSTDHPTFGNGLDASGKLPAGGQFVAMLHQLFPSGTTDFSGYVFIITDFTNAHGEFFISDFANFTHGALMLVVNTPSLAAGRTVEQGLDQ